VEAHIQDNFKDRVPLCIQERLGQIGRIVFLQEDTRLEVLQARRDQVDLRVPLGQMEDQDHLGLNTLEVQDLDLRGQNGPRALGLGHSSLADPWGQDREYRDRCCQEAVERCTTFLLTV